MYLQCYTVQNTGQRMGQYISAHSVSQNTGKTKWAWTLCILYPYSPTGYTFGEYKAAPLHQVLPFSKGTSQFCPCSSSLQARKPRMSSSSVRSCNCTTFPGRLHTSFQTVPTKLSPVLQLWNVITTRVASAVTWPGILGEILHSIASYLTKRDVVQHTNN